jgi:hypothetical protein
VRFVPLDGVVQHVRDIIRELTPNAIEPRS